MDKKQKTVTVLVALALCGAIAFVGSRVFYSPKHKPTRSVSSEASQASDSPGSISVAQSSNPLDLGQIPASGVDGAKKPNVDNVGNTVSSEVNPASFAQYDKYKDQTSGLFGEIKKGDGAELTLNKQAVIVYRGWLTNGTLFDESKKDTDGKWLPLAFTVGNHEVVAGMEQTVVGMKKGGSRLLIIPPAVGYGDQPHQGIPASSVLVFEVVLADVR